MAFPTKSSPPKLAIVCTLRLPSAERGVMALRSWCRYHAAVGFRYAFLFFDDPLLEGKCREESNAIQNSPRAPEASDRRDRSGSWPPQHPPVDSNLLTHVPAAVAVSKEFAGSSTSYSVASSEFEAVVVAGQSPRLREWQHCYCPSWDEYVEFLDDEVQARQTMNAETALVMAAHREVDWLLHIDSDELFFTGPLLPLTNLHEASKAQEEKEEERKRQSASQEDGRRVHSKRDCPIGVDNKVDSNCATLDDMEMTSLFYPPSAAAHFAELDHEGVLQMTYVNHEGVPERADVNDYFSEITLFRQHHFTVPLSPEARDAMQFWQRRTNHGQYLLVYDNGKSATRVLQGVRAKSVHSWLLPMELEKAHQRRHFQKSRQGTSQFRAGLNRSIPDDGGGVATKCENGLPEKESLFDNERTDTKIEEESRRGVAYEEPEKGERKSSESIDHEITKVDAQDGIIRRCTALADPRSLDVRAVRRCVYPCILHYVTCGERWLSDKYEILGAFDDSWFGGKLPIAPSFHLDARDVVLSSHSVGGGAVNREDAESTSTLSRMLQYSKGDSLGSSDSYDPVSDNRRSRHHKATDSSTKLDGASDNSRAAALALIMQQQLGLGSDDASTKSLCPPFPPQIHPTTSPFVSQTKKLNSVNNDDNGFEEKKKAFFEAQVLFDTQGSGARGAAAREELTRQLSTGVCSRIATVADVLNADLREVGIRKTGEEEHVRIVTKAEDLIAPLSQPTAPTAPSEVGGYEKAWLLSSIAQNYL